MVLLMFTVLIACKEDKSQINNDPEPVAVETEEQTIGDIYLYGEAHNVKAILDEELKLWGDYYSQGMRHLFVEMPYFTAEYLNIWMSEDNDEILDKVYQGWRGTQSQSEDVYNFYMTIKKEYPETVFHGTDVGHQFDTTGAQFRAYLLKNDMEDTEMYRLTIEAINQGKKYYKGTGQSKDHDYRENKMAENFVREFDMLKGESVMGIYGGAHTDFEALAYNGTVPNMASQLKKVYPDNIFSTDLRHLVLVKDPLRIDDIEVQGKTYKASYFGQVNMNFMNYVSREYWRLEEAYEDFKDYVSWDVLPYTNYPMPVEEGQVFLIKYLMKDGSVRQAYYRSDGFVWDGLESTFHITNERLEKIEEPLSVVDVTLGDKTFSSEYYGKHELEAVTGGGSLEYWKLLDAYESLQGNDRGDFMFQDANYPFEIKVGEVYKVNFNLEDGRIFTYIMICDGSMYKNKLRTIELRD